MSRNDLPSEKAGNFPARLRETIQTMLGLRGDKLDRVLTLRDLAESGLAAPRPGAQVGAGPVPLLPGPNATATYEPDLTPPPQPTGFAVDAAISHLFISHDAPVYRQGRGHLRTRVYGVTVESGDPLPTFDDAVEITQFSGTVHAHPSNPSTTWRLWIKWETRDEVLSPTPAGGTNGLEVTTGQDVGQLLDALSGQITESHLFADLGSRINLIDGPQTLPNSVAARLAAVRVEQDQLLAIERQARTSGLLAEAAARGTAISNETTQRITATSALQSQINMLSAASSGDLSELLAAVQEEQAARIAGDEAEALQRTTLAAQFTALADEVAYGADLDEVNRLGSEALVAAERVRASAEIDVERVVRASADGALATQITAMGARVGTAEAALVTEQTVRASADSALSSSITTLTTRVGNTEAGISTEQTARINGDNALAASINSLAVAVNTADAALAASVQEESAARSTAVEAEALQRSLLAARVTSAEGGLVSNAASIASESTARANADAALASQITTLASTVSGNSAAIQAEANTRASADSANASAIQTVRSQVLAGSEFAPRLFFGFDVDGALEGWGVTPSDAPRAVQGGTLVYTPTDSNSYFNRALGGSNRYMGADAPSIRARVRRLSGSSAWQGTCFYSTASHGSSNSFRKTIQEPSDLSQWNVLEWDMGNLTAGGSDYLDSEITAIRIDLDQSVGAVWEIDWISVGQRDATPLSAAIQAEATTRATAIAAEATARQTLQSVVNGNTSAIQTEATTRATQTGELYAQYTIKTDVAGLVSGYGLASSANNAAPTSSFGVRASSFYVAPPSVSSATAPTTNLYSGYVWLDTSVTPNVTRYYTGTAWSTTPQNLPFIVQATPTTINGVAVPAGVYMRDAYLQNGTVTNLKVANGAIDDLKVASVSASKLTAGSIAVGQHIQSTGYVASSVGWRINGDGTAEFSGVVVRGTVIATAGSIGGITIASNAVRAGQTAYNTGTGFHLGSDGRFSLGSGTGNRLTWDGTNLNVVGGGTFSGALSAATGSFAGSLSAATGSFAGSLSGATGTFSGALTANAINAVNTVNIAGNAVTIPVSAYTAASMSIGTAETVVQSLTIDPQSASVLVNGVIYVTSTGSSPSGTVRVRRNGSTVWQVNTIFPNTYAFALVDSPGAGTHTYDVTTTHQTMSTGGLSVSARSLSVIGIRR